MKKLVLIVALVASPVFADEPEVVAVQATPSSDGWRFNVSILHADTGWDDYADGWDVIDAEGNVLGSRPLAHPHVNEQPFTRGTSGVVIPEGTTQVFIRVRDNVHGWYETRTPVDLTAN